MVISNLNIDLLFSRLKIINDSLLEMKELSRLSKKDFLNDKRNPSSCETYLRHAIDAIFDIGRHILSKTGNSSSWNTNQLQRVWVKKELSPKFSWGNLSLLLDTEIE